MENTLSIVVHGFINRETDGYTIPCL